MREPSTALADPITEEAFGPSETSIAADPHAIGPVVLAALAFLLPVAWSNALYEMSTGLRSALLFVVVGPGLVALVLLCRRRDRAAWWAAGFLAAAVAAMALSDSPVLSLVGEFASQTGLVFVAACIGLWALGTWVGRSAERAVATAVIAAALVNAAVAWLQTSTDLGIAGLGTYGGRAQGLLGNPVFLAAFCAAALWLVLDRERQEPRSVTWLAATTLLVGAIELSGSRIALVLAFGVVGWFAARYLRQRAFAGALLLVAALVVGFALAQVPGESAGSGSQRLDEATASGLPTRMELWRTAIDAAAERPLLGYGPARSSVATTPRRTLKLAKYEGPDILYSDVHNFLIEELVTTGAIGLIAFAGWLVISGRRARGPLAGFAAVAGVTMLMQPLDVGLTPVVALAFGIAGASAVRSGLPRRTREVARTVAGVLAVVGLAFAVVMLTGDAAFRRGAENDAAADVDRADSRLPPWPEIPAAISAIRSAQALRERATEANPVLTAQRAAIARDPSDPRWWYQLGDRQLLWSTPKQAEVSYRVALKRNPWSANAQYGLMLVALREKDRAEASHWRDRLCQIGPKYCPPQRMLNLAQPDTGASPAGR